MIAVTIYSRPGCHLCTEMKALVEQAARTTPLVIHEVDVSADPALETRYGLEIPVLFVEGQKVAKYRISEQQLQRILTARAGREG